MNQDLRSVFIGVFSNILTPFIVSTVTIAIGLFATTTIEWRIFSFNIALILFLVSLQLFFRFSPKRPLIVRQAERNEIYLAEGNTCRHIPDRETFAYLGQLMGFQWTDVKVVSPAEFEKRFSAGSVLPSIRPHCDKISDRAREKETRQGDPEQQA